MNGRRPAGRLCGGFNEQYSWYGNLPRRAREGAECGGQGTAAPITLGKTKKECLFT